MKNYSTRRTFVRNIALSSIGLTVLSSLSPSHALTVSHPSREVVHSKVDMRRLLINSKKVIVKGKLYDSTGKKILAHHQIEILHLAPNSKKRNYSAMLTTDSNGAYEFITDFPNRINAKMPQIQIKDMTSQSENKLYLTHFDAHISHKHWKKNSHLKDDILFPRFKKKGNTIEVLFNITTN